MYRGFIHVVFASILSMVAMAMPAYAVSLGKFDVASHLGEPFFGEVALNLDANEKASDLTIEVASPTDYRILEVFRDTSLNLLQTDVKTDARGSRVELKSESAIESPFFNLVLKIRQGRSTHFKKFPVFLELPNSASAQAPAPQPQVKPVVQTMAPEEAAPAVENPLQEESDAQQVAAEKETAGQVDIQPTEAFKAFDNWARTARYGPMVFGDTITTVAKRIQVDDRFTKQQVMMALYEKNRSKFSQNNINLIEAGTYLDVPTAAEVERISPSMARQMLQEQNKAWKTLTQEPEYAAVEEAQKNRYSKRVRVGESATGVASKPVTAAGEMAAEAALPVPATSETKQSERSTETEKAAATTTEKTEPASSQNSTASGGVAGSAAASAELDLLRQQVAMLEEQNFDLEAKLNEYETRQPSDVEAALKEQNKKLELKLARMQADLDKVRQAVAAGEGGSGGMFNWLTWVLVGLIVLLSAGVGFLLRQQRAHPAVMDDVGDEMIESIASDAAEEFASDAGDMDFAEPEIPSMDETLSQDSTTQMDAEDLGMSLPDLTDEDTSEMEAFQEEDEEPDPNVDYLSEADVYMRYGMEDEAEKQVELALRLDASNAEAHQKMVEIRKARGDESGANNAIENAKSILTGDALAAFSAAVGVAVAGAAEAVASEEVSDVAGEQDQSGELELPSMDADDGSADDGLDMNFDDVDFGSDTSDSTVDESDDGLEMSFDDLDMSSISDEGSDIAQIDEEAVDLGGDSTDEDEGMSFDDLDLSSFGSVAEDDSDSSDNEASSDDDGLEMSFDDMDFSALDEETEGDTVSNDGVAETDDLSNADDDGLEMSFDDLDLSTFGDEDVVAGDDATESTDSESDFSADDDGLEMSFDDMDMSSLGGDDEADEKPEDDLNGSLDDMDLSSFAEEESEAVDESLNTSDDDSLDMSFDDSGDLGVSLDDLDLSGFDEESDQSEASEDDFLSESDDLDVSLDDMDLSSFSEGDGETGDESLNTSDDDGLDMSFDDLDSLTDGLEESDESVVAEDASLDDLDLSSFGIESSDTEAEEEPLASMDDGLDMSFDDLDVSSLTDELAEPTGGKAEENLDQEAESYDLSSLDLSLDDDVSASLDNDSNDVDKTIIMNPGSLLDDDITPSEEVGVENLLQDTTEDTATVGLDLDSLDIGINEEDELDVNMDDFSSTIEANFDFEQPDENIESVELDLNSNPGEETDPDFKLETFNGSDESLDLDVSSDLDDLLGELDMDDEDKT